MYLNCACHTIIDYILYWILSMPIVKVMLCDKYSKAQQFSEKDVFYIRKYGVSCNTFNMTHLTEEFELYTKKSELRKEKYQI